MFNSGDCCRRHAELLGDFLLGTANLKEPADFTSIGIGQLRPAITFATTTRTVAEFVGFIFLWRLPFYTPRRNTPQVAPTAIMARIMPGGRRRPMDDFTDKAVDALCFAVVLNLSVTTFATSEWPE